MANEKRLIDANALEALFDERNSDTFMQFRTRENKDYWWGVNGGINWGVNTIRDAPTVDAVEVVRCKDCKHSIWDDEEAMWKCVYDSEFDEQYGVYFGFTEYNEGEHFCSYGERKDNGTV